MTFKSNSRLSKTACVHGTIENAHIRIYRYYLLSYFQRNRKDAKDDVVSSQLFVWVELA